MRNRKFLGLLSIIVLGLFALSLLIYFIGARFFNMQIEVYQTIKNIVFYSFLVITALYGFSYSFSRRNIIFSVLLIVFIGVIVIFEFVIWFMFHLCFD